VPKETFAQSVDAVAKEEDRLHIRKVADHSQHGRKSVVQSRKLVVGKSFVVIATVSEIFDLSAPVQCRGTSALTSWNASI